jgi:hypothetical protein
VDPPFGLCSSQLRRRGDSLDALCCMASITSRRRDAFLENEPSPTTACPHDRIHSLFPPSRIKHVIHHTNHKPPHSITLLTEFHHPLQHLVPILTPPRRYATSSTINAYSALIQNYFSNQTLPFPAVHLTVDTALTASGDGLGVKGYSSLPIGTADPKPENCVFLPVPVGIKFAQSERAGREFLAAMCVGSR